MPAIKAESQTIYVGLFVVLLTFFVNIRHTYGSNSGDVLAGLRNLSINDGLSQNLVLSISQDKLGFIWIGTKDGLNLYDGYTFRVFKHNPFDPYSISDNFIKTIYCDDNGRIWVGTLNGGLNLYERETGRFIRFLHDPNDPNSISNDNVQAIVADNHGNLWIGTNGGGLNKITPKPNSLYQSNDDFIIVRFVQNAHGFSIPDREINHLIRSRDGLIWVATGRRIFTIAPSAHESLIREIPVEGKILPSIHSGNVVKPNHAGRMIVLEDHEGQVWMLSRSGLFRYDRTVGSFRHYFNKVLSGLDRNPLAAVSFRGKEETELWLAFEQVLVIFNTETNKHVEIFSGTQRKGSFFGGNIISLFADMSGAMWIGSNGYGLSVFDPYTVKFRYPDDKGYTANGVAISSRELSIRAFVVADDGYLWLGTNRGLFKIDRLSSTLKEVELEIYLKDEIFSIIHMHKGKNGTLWLGTNAGLLLFDPRDNSVKIYPTGLNDSVNEIEPRVSRIFFAENGQLWVLTPNTIALFDQKEGSFTHKRYTEEPLNRFKEVVFPYAWEDRKGNFWLAAHNGLHYFHTETWNIKSFSNNPKDVRSLPFNNVRSILPDPYHPDDYIWLATGGGGISMFDILREEFLNFSERDGLSNNMVYGMLADTLGNFWLSTNHGLSKFMVMGQKFVNYTISDGLQSNEFNSGAFYQGPEGELFFGGIHGYNCFFPHQIVSKSLHVPVVFTGFKLMTQSGEGRYMDISEKDRLELGFRQNHFMVSFASLDFANSYRNRFAYAFDTSGERWIEIGETHSLTFGDLKPGNYTLKIRGTNNDGVWSDNEAVLKIFVAKPFWASNFMLLLYGVAFVLLFLSLRNYEMSRIHLRNKMRLSTMEAKKLKELDQIKTKFFSNISHEFRTPLTLIKGPIENLIDEADEPRKRELLTMVYSNSLKLQNLIDQLLDLTKLESGQFRIKVSKGDIVDFVRGAVMLFASLAQQRNIQLRFLESSSVKHMQSDPEFYFDRDSMEKILNNLVSNAFKFSPDGGRITVSICLRERKRIEPKLEIVISDTGIGIAKDKIPFIYDRFYQVDDASNRKFDGTGIGLAYVKELIELHMGTISVFSRPGKGTTFRLRFPLGRSAFLDDQIGEPMVSPPNFKRKICVDDASVVLPKPVKIPDSDQAERPIILIVEDHQEVRQYISYSLEERFVILEAADADEGIKMANETIPDLIICDVMMPGTDGFGMCEIIKKSEKTSHIPLILLSARALEVDKLHGLEVGADDYLIKPFSSKELRSRIFNLIENRRLLREKFNVNAIVKPGEVMVTSRDSLFMEKLLAHIESHIGSENFSVDDLALLMNMSHSQLHRKLKALINQSVSQYIRSVKMNRAKELIEKDAGNIAEISFMVGFGDPGYFTKTFKAFHGVLPSEVKKTIDQK